MRLLLENMAACEADEVRNVLTCLCECHAHFTTEFSLALLRHYLMEGFSMSRWPQRLSVPQPLPMSDARFVGVFREVAAVKGWGSEMARELATTADWQHLMQLRSVFDSRGMTMEQVMALIAGDSTRQSL